MPDSTNIRPRRCDARPTRLLCVIVAVALALLVEAGSLRANVVSGATAVDGLIFSWQYDLSGGAGFVLIENVAHNLGGPPSDIGLVDMLPRSATNILVGPQMEDYACVSSAVVLQNVLAGQTPGNAAVVTFNFPAAAVSLVERPVGVYDYYPVTSACACGVLFARREMFADFVCVESIDAVDTDADGVPDVDDVCRFEGEAGDVLPDGRPVGDVNGDCAVTLADAAAMVDDLLAQ
ncbi:MAG TPA: hypothetical protein P5081_17160 [Phycisphaerae bacterium]|nr:hypothetical protein [Phycisphaerae bacterium]HRW54603.1 hypothetical protein [Phycisphaerae bacterium]